MNELENDPEAIEKWQVRRREYLRRSRPLKISLALVFVLLIAALFELPHRYYANAIWLFAASFAIAFVIDGLLIKRYLICPHCDHCALFASHGRGLISSSDPNRCHNCAGPLKSSIGMPL
jgi:hypothetical protein